MTWTKNKLLRQLMITFCLTVCVFVFGLNSDVVEHFYSSLFYKYLSSIQRSISGIFPFSLGDILYILFIGFLLFRVCRFLRLLSKPESRKTSLLTAPLRLLNLVLVLYIAFKLLWGLNYSRHSVASSLNIGDEKYSPEQLSQLARFLIMRINSIERERFEKQKQLPQHYTAASVEDAAAEAYRNMAIKNTFFAYRQPALKKVLNTYLITKIGLEGYYNPLSGEANVNMRIPAHSLPFVACHEIAHQLGVGREDEANLVGYIVASNSKDVYFRYSAVYSVLRNVLFELRLKAPEDYESVSNLINPGTKQDFEIDRAFWMKYNSDMYAYMDVALDSFLKLNNQQKGINSYQDIVIWVYNLHKKALQHP